MSVLTDDPDHNIDLVCDLANECFPDNQILADLTATQAILESRLTYTPSLLATKYNNLFGIKGEGTGIPRSVSLSTHEFYGGHMHVVPQPFANNATLEDSFAQHKKLFDLPRYRNLYSAKTFEEAAHLIHQDGYATDPAYPKLLIDIYNEYVKE
jgi:flagellum-specific peptidoglycan hydrolase FlgJ